MSTTTVSWRPDNMYKLKKRPAGVDEKIATRGARVRRHNLAVSYWDYLGARCVHVKLHSRSFRKEACVVASGLQQQRHRKLVQARPEQTSPSWQVSPKLIEHQLENLFRQGSSTDIAAAVKYLVSQSWRSSSQDELERAFQTLCISTRYSSGVRAVAAKFVPIVCANSTPDVLASLLRNSEPAVAYSAALTSMEWALGYHTTQSISVSENALNTVTIAVVERWRREWSDESESKDSLREALVWALGALSTAIHLADTAGVIAQSFVRGLGAEHAAAVRAGRLLIKRLDEEAVRVLRESLKQLGNQYEERYTKLLVKGS